MFATWRHVAVIARESERLNRCVEELVRERAERETMIREARREARLDAERTASARVVRLESANDALMADLRDASDAAQLARGEVAFATGIYYGLSRIETDFLNVRQRILAHPSMQGVVVEPESD